ncbi:MAG: TspO/MBR family protein [Verrucomicrobiota bacterium]
METELERLARERKERCGWGGTWRLCGLTLLCVTVGAVSGAATRDSIPTWYAGLQKPAFNPPNWIFAPMWSTLYLLFGCSMGLAWERGADRLTKTTFFALLCVNGLWSLLFFGLRSPGLALIDIAAYLLLLSSWVRMLARHDRTAAWLQVPHLLWVAFAAVLNASIWWLNQ